MDAMSGAQVSGAGLRSSALKSMDECMDKGVRFITEGVSLAGLRKLRERLQQMCARGFFDSVCDGVCDSELAVGKGIQEDGLGLGLGLGLGIDVEIEGSTARGLHTLKTTQLMAALRAETEEGWCMLEDKEWVQAEDVGRPTHFISHSWESTVGNLFDSIESYVSNTPDGACVWLDIVATSPHRTSPLSPLLLQSVLDTCQGGVVAVVDTSSCFCTAASPVKCAWSLFVWSQTLSLHGIDQLHLVSVSPTDWNSLVASVDITQATCAVQSDKGPLLDHIQKLYGSFPKFNQTLRLQLLLRPLSYSIDLDQLWRRSRETVWRLQPVKEWLDSDPEEHRALCVLGGGGTGKSTISAAIINNLLGGRCSHPWSQMAQETREGALPNQGVLSKGWRGGLWSREEEVEEPRASGQQGDEVACGRFSAMLSAHHFLKYNDQRRLDPLRVVQSLAFQVAVRAPPEICAPSETEAVPPSSTATPAASTTTPPNPTSCNASSSTSSLQRFTSRLLSLGCSGARDVETLLQLMVLVTEPVLILLDALDEGDPPELVPGFSGTVQACSNKVMQLITRYLSVLPPNFRFVFTSRPDALCFGIEAALHRLFIGLTILSPWELRHGEQSEATGERVLLYETVVRECLSGVAPKLLPENAVPDYLMLPLYSAYFQTFKLSEQQPGSASREEIMKLLQVLMAAKEPLSHGMLRRMGLLSFLDSLPGWGVLFYTADHHIYQLHKSLCDWLLDPIAAQEYHVDVSAGHLLIGKHLMDGVRACTREHIPSSYTLHYVFSHLAGASTTQLVEASEILDCALGSWEFLRHVFRSPTCAANMVQALGSIPRRARSPYTDDAFLWTRRLFHDLIAQPDNLEKVTLSGCPIKTAKYREALDKEEPGWVTEEVFGGSCGEWPPDQAILKGHTDWLYSLAYSPDGRQLASSSKDGTIRIWGISSGQVHAKLEGHSGIVLNVTFNPDGKQLASSGDDHSVRLWDLASGMCTSVLQGHTSWVYHVAYSPDGMHLTSAGCDRVIKLWDVASEECTRTLQGHTDFVYGVAYSPGGNVLASASKDETIRIWDTATGECTMVLRGHTKEVFSVAFRSDGSLLGSASYDRTIKLWDMTSGACVRTLRGHMNIVLSVSFSPEMTQLASTGSDLTIKLWDIESGDCLETFLGHTDACFSVSYSPDGTQLASASADRTVRLWDLTRSSQLEGHTSWIHSVAWGPPNSGEGICGSGRWLASCSRDETIKLWDLDTRQCTRTLHGHSDVVHCLSVRPAGDLIASASLDNTLRLWNVTASSPEDSSLELEGHANGAICVAFSPDGQQLASGSMDSSVKLWDVGSGNCVATLVGHHNTVWSVAFSPCGKTLVSGAADYKIKLWSVATHQCLITLQGHTHHVIWLSFRHDGKQLASSSSDNTIKIWDMVPVQKQVDAGTASANTAPLCNAGSCLMTLRGHADFVQSVCYSPDGKRLISGSKDKLVMVWDLEAGECLATLLGHSGWVYSVAFSPEGDQIVTSSADGTLRLWRECSHATGKVKAKAKSEAVEECGRVA